MSRRDRAAVSIAALLVAACCVAAVGFVAPAGAQSAAIPQTDDQPAPDNTITRIDLTANGSATWEITLRTRLESDSDVAEYERFQEGFRSNTSRYVDPFADRMSGVVAAANDSSDREMRAGGFDAETGIQEVPRRWGVVSFRFTWTGFAAVDGDAVVVGDVFAGGFFIDEDDALAIAAPDGYVVESTAPAPDETADGVVEWRGREDFDDGRPRVRAVPTTGDGGSPADGDGGPGTGVDEGGLPVGVLVLAGVLLVALAGAAYAIRTGRVSSDREAGAGGAAGRPGGDDATDPTADGERAAADGDPVGGTAADPDLLTDEDRVRRLLREREGRMKQSAIVDELGWSKSKASRVLSGMADEGEVEKLRIGRENVIDLVDDEE
jgi:hypothetical protein